MKVKLTSVTSIKPYKNNPRHNINAVAKVAESIKTFGFQQPIVTDSKGVIIVGHTRLLAAKELNIKKVPVVIATELTAKQIKAYRIADNKVAEYSEWDDDLLSAELEGLKNIFTGFEGDELNNVLGNIESTDFPDLASGGRNQLEQITFTLHTEQADIVREAVDKAKKKNLDTSLNDNSNGNALSFICSKFK